ncbi:GC-rich sequence DNA-binding factor 2 isoform X4 [Rhinopithecus roxellana]|uniref:GC-rich sequence DNA-binding factor 2 isoform X4 n=1 Tax=Rhinopithecus roxellana TaxID=61622 RepID=UPI0012372078|nr:GC-rich sequence DNA-binding factor 2 isoform X4 [Rhinopithecus roxellana]
MAHRPKRTFRQRAADSSDSDGAEESPAEPGAPREVAAPGSAEEGPPSGGGRAPVAGRPHRVRGPGGRGRVWASSRRAKEAAPRENEGSGVQSDAGKKGESRVFDMSTDEEDEIHHSSESKDDQGLSSDSSSSLGEKELSSTVKIPDAAFIQAARRKRELARAQDDYISLDVEHTSTVSGMKKESEDDPESEPDDHEKRIPFTLKPQTFRQRMAEESISRNEETSEESQEDEKQDIWERQQMRKAVKIIEERDIDLSHRSGSSKVKKFDTSISFTPVNLEIIKKQLNTRTKRRQARMLSGNCNHQEGTSSDDELPSAEMIDFQKSQGDILQKQKKVFEDVHDDFCNIQNILLKFQQWREKFPDSYYEAFISLCIPKLLNPLIRVQLIDWNPLKLDSTGLKEMPWFKSVEEFMDSSVEDSKKESSSDKKILSTIINKTIIPRLTDFVEFLWDPLSTSQTTSLITHCRVILEEHSICENEVSKSKQDLLKSIVSRMKKAVEDDVFIPLYPKSAVENKTSPHSEFQERQFWSGLKLFHNILLWNGLLTDDTLQELGLGKLLNRYLIIALLNATPGPDVIKKCNQIAACLPEKWFENSTMRTSIPQLENFIQFLLQSAHRLSRSEFRNKVEEIILILVKIKALNQAESFIGEHHLDHLKSLI